jgi:hypothetical protein
MKNSNKEIYSLFQCLHAHILFKKFREMEGHLCMVQIQISLEIFE